jgi:hypothetical protein
VNPIIEFAVRVVVFLVMATLVMDLRSVATSNDR